jgi:hypothetical protein
MCLYLIYNKMVFLAPFKAINLLRVNGMTDNNSETNNIILVQSIRSEMTYLPIIKMYLLTHKYLKTDDIFIYSSLILHIVKNYNFLQTFQKLPRFILHHIHEIPRSNDLTVLFK